VSHLFTPLPVQCAQLPSGNCWAKRLDFNHSPKDHHMAERPRYWGIDVIAAFYTLATVWSALGVWLIWWLGLTFSVSGLFAIVITLLCGFFAVGVFRRFRRARIILMVTLVLAIVGDCSRAVYYLLTDPNTIDAIMFHLPMNGVPMTAGRVAPLSPPKRCAEHVLRDPQ
jgi:hypothetical protein